MPTIQATSLRSDLVLPPVTPTLDYCVLAATSMRKALLVCGLSAATPTQGGCDIPCGASWNSALRESLAIVDTGCLSLENAVNQVWGPAESSGVSSTGAFTITEWENIQQKCLQSPCGESWCSLSAVRANSLYPPYTGAEGCPGFVATDGVYTWPFLTWTAVMYYQDNNLGCTGGLSVIADDEFKTWACVHAPQCAAIVADDLACFKYNDVRGEFSFWGWNARLKVAPALFQLPASFCNDQGVSVLLDARKPEGAGVALAGMSYAFYRFSQGELRIFRSGTAEELADGGCGPVRLAPDTRFWLEVTPGSGYYPWKGWWTSVNEDIMRGNPQEIALAIYPNLATPGFYGCDWLGITLQWCISEPLDLDLFLFVPLEEGGDFRLERPNAIYWATMDPDSTAPDLYTGPYEQNGGEANGGATIVLERDDIGEPDGGGPRTFGPESIVIKGTPMPGRYAVVATIWISDPLSPLVFSGGCATVGLFSGNLEGGQVIQRQVGAKGRNGHWWHVLNIVVSYDGPDEGVPRPVRYSYEMVDRIIPGPFVQEDGYFADPPFTGPGDPEPEILMLRREVDVYDRQTQENQWLTEQHCKSYAKVGLELFSSVTSLPLVSGTFSPDGGLGAPLDIERAVLQYRVPEGFSGGYGVLEGQHNWLIQSPGYAPYELTFKVDLGTEHLFYGTYLVPADGETRVVLRWGDAPQDLDLHIVPVGVVDPSDGSEAQWVWQDPVTEEEWLPEVYEGDDAELRPYVWWGVGGQECGCVDHDDDPATECRPLCALSATGPDYESRPTLTLDRDDQIHGRVSATGRVYNAPEVATLKNLWPGTYRVYISAYQPEGQDPGPEFESEVNVDIWLGDGSTVSSIGSVTHRAGRGGRWLYAGYFSVTDDLARCTNPNQKPQVSGGMCYSWYAARRVVFAPLSNVYHPVRMRMAHALFYRSDLAAEGVSFHRAQYVVYSGGACSCVGSVSCTCTGSTIISTGVIGADLPVGDPNHVERSWTGALPIYLTNGQYQIKVGLPGFYDRMVTVDVADGAVDAPAVMTPIVEEGGLRVVLTWGARPWDMDLWVVRAGVPRPNWLGDPPEQTVFWGMPEVTEVNEEGVNEMAGIVLNRDEVNANGPETVTFSPAVASLRYRVAVNVYSDEPTLPDEPPQCVEGEDTGCFFRGGETVQFFTSAGLLAETTFNTNVGTWWVVGTIEKDIAGGFSFDFDPVVEGERNGAGSVADGSANCLDIYDEC